MGGYERGPQGLGNARMGLPGEEIAETEGTPYEDESGGRTRGLPEHERDDDVAGDVGGGMMSSGGTASDYGRPSGEGAQSADGLDDDDDDDDDDADDDEDDLIRPDNRGEDVTGGFLADREPRSERRD